MRISEVVLHIHLCTDKISVKCIMTETADVFCTSLAHSYILNMNSDVNESDDSSRPSAKECSPTQLLNERRKFTSELMRIKQDLFARVDVVVEPSTEMSLSLLTHPMVESRVQSASSHLDSIYLKLCDDLDGFEAQSRKRLRVQREIESRLVRCARNLGRLQANGDNRCDIYKFIDILEQSLEQLYDDVAEFVGEIRSERTTARLWRMLVNMSQGNKCKLACRKTKDYYDYLAKEYISKHTCPCPGENGCISTCEQVIVTPEILNERRSFTAALAKIRHDVLDHADQLGLFSKRHPHSTTLDHVRFLSQRLDAMYWQLSAHLDVFQLNGSKRLRLRDQIETRILLAVRKLETYEDEEQHRGRNYYRELAGGRSSNYGAPCSAAYMRYVNDLLDVFSEKVVGCVRELKEERRSTVWRRICC